MELSLNIKARDQLGEISLTGTLHKQDGCRQPTRWQTDAALGPSGGAGVGVMASGADNRRAGGISPRVVQHEDG